MSKKKKKPVKPDVEAVLEMADKYLAKWLKDLNSGVGEDHGRYLRENEVFQATKPLIEAAPDLRDIFRELSFAYDHKHDSTCREGKGACLWVDVEDVLRKAEGKK